MSICCSLIRFSISLLPVVAIIELLRIARGFRNYIARVAAPSAMFCLHNDSSIAIACLGRIQCLLKSRFFRVAAKRASALSMRSAPFALMPCSWQIRQYNRQVLVAPTRHAPTVTSTVTPEYDLDFGAFLSKSLCQKAQGGPDMPGPTDVARSKIGCGFLRCFASSDEVLGLVILR